MDAEAQKTVAQQLLHASDKGDIETVAALTSEDFTFQFMEQAETWAVDGKEVSTRLNKADYLKFGVPAVTEITQDGMHFAVDLVIADGPWVAIFGRSNAVSKKGRPYANTYCWRMQFTDDKVSEFREYCDTHHAREVLFE